MRSVERYFPVMGVRVGETFHKRRFLGRHLLGCHTEDGGASFGSAPLTGGLYIFATRVVAPEDVIDADCANGGMNWEAPRPTTERRHVRGRPGRRSFGA